MTKRQRETLDFIIRFISDRGYSPSYAEIADALRVASLATVFKHVNGLMCRGYLEVTINRTRGLIVKPEYLEEYRTRKSVIGHCCPTCNGTGRVSEATA